MTTNILRRHLLACLVIGFAFLPMAASAETLAIQYTGLDIVYDGSAIKTVGGVDALQSIDFSVDDVNVLSFNAPADSPMAIELELPGVANIPVAGGTVTSAAGGTLSLTLPGGDYLDLELGEASVVYQVLDLGIVKLNFVLAASAGDVLAQVLPLEAFAGPIAVSFSTQVVGSSLKSSGGFLTEFKAGGTGEIKGMQIPEPTGAAILISGLLFCLAGIRRRG
ncbi:MAG TPA: hypothetical protein DD670_20335 [Planctomycetaceae bacterium]|nr:hypothetical protein [Planctomycetaceae bacterium]